MSRAVPWCKIPRLADCGIFASSSAVEKRIPLGCQARAIAIARDHQTAPAPSSSRLVALGDSGSQFATSSSTSNGMTNRPSSSRDSPSRLEPGDRHSSVSTDLAAFDMSPAITGLAMDNLPGLDTLQPTSCSSQMDRVTNAVVPSTMSWGLGTEDLRSLRSRAVVLIERLLRNHQPHDVLSQVAENIDWQSKTFKLALKMERLIFRAASSRDDYLDEFTLARRVKSLSRHLVRLRMHKNRLAREEFMASQVV